MVALPKATLLIDTDVLIHHLTDPSILAPFQKEFAERGVFLSTISYMEIYEGAITKPTARHLQGPLEDMLTEAFTLIPFAYLEARRCAQIKADLRIQGKRVRSRALDLMIAATALEHDLVLATRNVRDYQDIARLDFLDLSSD